LFIVKIGLHLTVILLMCQVLCAQVNSASYRQWDGKRVVAYKLCGEGLVWLIGVVVCLLAALWGVWLLTVFC